MKSKLSPVILSTLLLMILLAGCSKKSTNANANSNSNTNTTTSTLENSNLEEMPDDSSTTTPTARDRNSGKTSSGEKTTNGAAPKSKPTPEKEPPVKSTEKQVKKQGDRALKDAGGLINEGERRVRGILNGRP